MRRISLAVALFGAIAAAGCGGNKAPNSSGTSKGTPGSTFTIQVRGEAYNYTDPVTNTSVARPVGGTITSTPPGLNCGDAGSVCSFDFAWDSSVVLNVTTSAGYAAWGFAGACTGHAGCTVSGNSDTFVLVRFAADLSGVGVHANFSSPSVHGPEYLKTVLGQTGSYPCASCHGGAALLGAGLAPSCASCHAWPLSAHFNPASPAFGDHNGWGAGCLRCHTSQGFQDYAGNDGSANYSMGTFSTTSTLTATTAACTATGTCDPAAYRYGPLKCETCHTSVINPVAITGVLGAGSAQLNSVYWFQATTPSTSSSTLDASSAICAQCHQARESAATIESKITAWGPTYVGTGNANVLNTNVSFLNPHYRGAAAIFYGAKAAGMVQYAGQIYTGANEHGGAAGCTYCHNAHTLELPPDGTAFYAIGAKCGSCHFNEAGATITTFAALEEARQFGFEGDVDGDGVVESIKAELDGVAAQVYANLQDYAVQVIGTSITYTENYPYFMNAQGTAMKRWTPRMMRAAVNLKWFHTESGAWAHNPRYMLEVLFDSAADLRLGIREAGFTPAAAFTAKRAFNGHFGAAEDPSPYAAMIYHSYDPGLGNAGFTSSACYQCHGGQGGFDAYVATAPAALTAAAQTNKVTAMQCDTCHTLNGTNMTAIRSVGTVYFPPQKNNAADAGQVSFTADQLPPGFTVCATCHSGRENGASITKKIGANTDANWVLSAVNPHYLGAAGMMMGSKAAVMFQYPGHTYTADPAFWATTANGPHGSPHGAQCTSCHAPKGSKHTFEINIATTVPPGTYHGAVNTQACNGCHVQSTYGDYRLAPKQLEFEDASAELYAALRAYVVTNIAAVRTATGNAAASGVCYNGNSHPYFFLEVSGVCQDGVANAPAASVGFNFNPTSLKGAFNYLWTQKEPGAWAHNEYYVLQVVYDSIVDLGGTPAFTVNAAAAGSPLNRP
jgi:hypothetical protein